VGDRRSYRRDVCAAAAARCAGLAANLPTFPGLRRLALGYTLSPATRVPPVGGSFIFSLHHGRRTFVPNPRSVMFFSFWNVFPSVMFFFLAWKQGSMYNAAVLDVGIVTPDSKTHSALNGSIEIDSLGLSAHSEPALN